jgi:predicted phosphodiesterase
MATLKNDQTKLQVALFDEEGLSRQRISEMLDIPVSTVKDFLLKNTHRGWWDRYEDGELDKGGPIKGVDAKLTISGVPVELHNFEHTAMKQALDGVWSLGKNLMVISDTHFPYHHPDTFDFIRYLKAKYNIDGAVSVGDMNDNHYPSFHEKEADCYSGSEELRLSRLACQELESIFPEMLISEGNHDILAKRKAQSADIPLEWVSSPNTVYDLKGGWEWGSHHYFMAGDSKVLLVHSVSTNTRNNATKYSHCSVQGHHHSEYCVAYTSDTDVLRWSMSVGCLIDPKSPAFRYDKNNILRRPILGLGVILNGTPMLEPMVLKSNGRWRGW